MLAEQNRQQHAVQREEWAIVGREKKKKESFESHMRSEARALAVVSREKDGS